MGRIHASDQDQYDVLVYNIIDPHHGLFNVNERSGLLTTVTGLDTGRYQLNVSVTDGKFTSYETVSVRVDSLDDDMLNEGISIRYVSVRRLQNSLLQIDLMPYTIFQITRNYSAKFHSNSGEESVAIAEDDYKQRRTRCEHSGGASRTFRCIVYRQRSKFHLHPVLEQY